MTQDEIGTIVERLERIENTVNAVRDDVNVTRSDVAIIKGDVLNIRFQMNGDQAAIALLKSDVNALKA